MLVDSYLSNWEFMASDLFLITPLAFLIPLAPAYHKLTYHKPVSSLFSFSIIFSMTLQTLFVAFFQIFAEELTSQFFPKDIFANYRECVGEFDKFKPFPEGGIFEDDIMEEEEDTGVEEEDAGTEEEKEAFNTDGGNSDVDNEEEEEEDIYYQECIDNSSIFYISFAQYLILAVAFCSGKPFKKNIFYNYGMLIFSIIGFIYSEYIVFYVDYFSRNFIYISAYPDDPFVDYYLLNNKQKNHHSGTIFKYHIMVIIVVNFIVSLFIEKVVVPKCNKCWKRNKMKKIKRRLENDYQREADLNLINNVKNYIRQQKAAKKSI
jgi:magnesium-transporting ATPase (P-type)